MSVLRGKNWPESIPEGSPIWKRRALAAEAEVERLVQRLAEAEDELEAADAQAVVSERKWFVIRNQGERKIVDEVTTIDVGRDFRRLLVGRKDGAKLREQLLIPALGRGERVVVDLGRCINLSAEFAEEAFGGLVRILGAGVVDRVEITCALAPTRATMARHMMSQARSLAKVRSQEK